MTWSEMTKFPYNSFVWRGGDGSEVVAHLCSTGYNGSVELDDVVAAMREHRQADVHPEMLLPTGFGDGGGGVTEQMCERARRLANLAGCAEDALDDDARRSSAASSACARDCRSIRASCTSSITAAR